MNCLEFRHHCVAAPRNRGSALLHHRRECPRCAKFAAGVWQFDQRVAEALRVEVPPDLAARIILRQSIHRGGTRKGQRTRLYALAASMLVTVGLTAGLLMMTRPPPLDRAVVARINAVPEALVARQDISDEKLSRVLDTLGGELKGNIGKVNYASIYYVHDHACGHLVVTGAKRPVTILLMPGIYVEHRRAIHSPRFLGVIVPTANGSMAIVGEQGENLHAIEQRMRSAVTWHL